jgi:branched-chain amino acid transport system substrate-binding protein
MKKLSLKILIVLMFTSILVAACGGATTPVPTAEPALTKAPITSSHLPAEIDLGAVHDLSGATALYGTSIQKGIDLAVKQMNEQKFFGEATTVKILYEDAAGNPKQAMDAFEKLTANPGVVAILGPTLSNEAKSADPIAQKAGMPVIASSNTASGITDIGNYIFRTSLPESAVIPNTIKVTKAALGLTKVAVMYGNNDVFTQSGFGVFKAAL